MVTDYLAALEARESFAIGELVVTFHDGEAVIAAPGAEAGEKVSPDEASLRARVRHDDHGRYRPLTGARTLPAGWFTRCPARSVEDAIDVIYPLAFTHARQHEAGTLRIVPLDNVLSRQSGRYSDVAQLSAGGRIQASDELCSRCVRDPVWRGDAVQPSGIPCPEPCSVLVSLCREAVAWEQDAPAPGPVDLNVPFADFEAAGNEVRESYLARAAARSHAT